MRWYEVTVTGESAHTGATPMRLRKNALLGAARLVERIDAIARAHAPAALGAVGLMEVRPNSRNVVPGEVFFCVDLRHPEAAVLDQLEAEYTRSLREICDPLGLTVSSTRIWDQPPVRFDAGCVASVRRAAALSGFSAREIISGAGHDAAYVSRVAPTAMIFVPCRDGISHNEAEFTSKEQCAAGAQVLLQAVLDYDRTLAERHARPANLSAVEWRKRLFGIGLRACHRRARFPSHCRNLHPRVPMVRPLAVRRHNEIVQRLRAAGSVSVGELANIFGVSHETIRRDLKLLADNGHLDVVHGGAARRGMMEPSIAQRGEENAEGKAAIAREAARMVAGRGLGADRLRHHDGGADPGTCRPAGAHGLHQLAQSRASRSAACRATASSCSAARSTTTTRRPSAPAPRPASTACAPTSRSSASADSPRTAA